MKANIFAAAAAALGLLFGATSGSTADSVPDWRDHGPEALIMTYKAAPGARPDFRAALRAFTLPKLERLKADGELKSYHVLANRYLDSAAWDVMVILDFKDSAALSHWRAVEAETPGGLAPEALKLVSSAEAAPSDLMFSRSAARKPGDPAPVYLVVPYDYLVSEDEYLAYVGGYLAPQTDGWIEAGALSSYGVYVPRYAAGRDWSALLVLAYRGDEGLARRDAVVKAVRQHLAATSPAWKAYADTKQKIRTEKIPMVADELVADGR